jgi:hypothetical protein
MNKVFNYGDKVVAIGKHGFRIKSRGSKDNVFIPFNQVQFIGPLKSALTCSNQEFVIKYGKNMNCKTRVKFEGFHLNEIHGEIMAECMRSIRGYE